MLILILIILIIVTIFSIFREFDEIASYTLTLAIVDFVVIIIVTVLLVNTRVIDNKIELYTEQNKKIENQVEIAVKNYMNFESDTYKDLKIDSYITLANLYPELKSNELVQQQINLYLDNNKKIISLNEKKINKKIYAWWLYFGK